MNRITVFSFGYKGWGNRTRDLVDAVDAVERSRGFEPPIFVDIRIRRSVRAAGFNGPAFERLMGRERHKWMKSLGNKRILMGAGPKIQIAEPAAAHDLLELATELSPKRRLIFFCNCPWPQWKGRDKCHRSTVASLVLKAASKHGTQIEAVEWPGGEPAAIDLRVSSEVFDAVRHGRKSIPLGQRLPSPSLLGLPWYSVVTLRSGTHQLQATCGPAKFIRHEWCLPVQQLYDDPTAELTGILSDVTQERTALGLSGRIVDGIERSAATTRDVTRYRRTPKAGPEYTSDCVYTILHSKKLADLFRSGRSGIFSENKKWVTAEKLLLEARSSGRVMPIVFAPGENTRELSHIAELEDVTITQNEEGGWSTTVRVTNLTKIPQPRPLKTRLRVSSTGATLSNSHIRPYVLVKTPSFLLQRAAKK